MKKIIKIAGLVLVIVIVALVAGMVLVGGSMVKGGINTFGPTVLGVPVTLQDASFKPFSGKIQLTKLHVGNPEGFKTPGLFDLGNMDIELDSKSLFSDTILIHKIVITAPEITYEKGLLSSNFSKLLEHLQGGEPAKDKKEPAKAGQDKVKKVIIEELIVSDPKLKLSVTAAGGHAIPIALGQVELKDIGKEHGGVTFSDAMKIILSIVTGNIENAVAGAGQLVGSGVKAVGEGAAAVGGAVVGGASSAVKGIGNLIGVGRKSQEKSATETGEAGKDK